jgi:hypothetical protein
MYSFALSLTSVLDGVGDQCHVSAVLSQKYSGARSIGAGWNPEPVWTVAKNLALSGIRSYDRPARSKSPYRLPYPNPLLHNTYIYIYIYIYKNKGLGLIYN